MCIRDSHPVRVANHLSGERRFISNSLSFYQKIVIAARHKYGLRVFQLTAVVRHFAEDARDVPATNPSSIDEDCKAIAVEPKISTHVSRIFFSNALKFRVNRYAADLDPAFLNAKINELFLRSLSSNDVQADIITGPTTPEPIARIGNHCYQRNFVDQSQVAQHSRQKMLRHRMH